MDSAAQNLQPRNADTSEAIPNCSDILGKLVNRAYKKAKTWSVVRIALDVILYVVGTVAIAWPALSLDYPWIGLPLSIAGFCLEARASSSKDRAELLKRHHEYLMGFGVPPERGELADLQMELSKELPEESEKVLREGITYWSKKSAGPEKALENLIESAWFTKHLSVSCVWVSGSAFAVTSLLAISLLLFVSTSPASASFRLVAAKCITATIVFLVTVRILKACFEYYTLSRAAATVDAAANQLLEGESPDSFAAQKILCEYQIARARGPLVPTWIWRIRRRALSDAWNRIKHP